MTNLRRARGFTLVEVVIAMTIFALIAISISQAVYFLSKQGQTTREKAYATQKAIQMMEELRSVVTSNGNIGILDNYNDGVTANPVLTTNLAVTNPGDASSGNGNGALYRIVTVVYMPNDPNSREVFVRVYDSKTHAPLAQTMSILRTLPNKFYPSQVFDIYLLALENVPGWWSLTDTLRPIVDNVAQNLQTINPGLVLRTHWVTQLAFGRDPFYTPYINKAAVATASPIPAVYYYPGLTFNKAKNANIFYYNPGFIAGQISADGQQQNTSGYSLADEFNHGMRYPDEWAAYQAAVASSTINGTTPPEVSLRILLEEMNQSTCPVTNLLLMNLHGEMLPLPPMRNYSDPAKDPVNHPRARVVTHPQWLNYSAGSEVKLRVYSYVTPEYLTTSTFTLTLNTLSVFIASVSIPSTSIALRKVSGGTQSWKYTWDNALNTAACVGGANSKLPQGTDDYCVYNPAGGGTEIVVVNSPLRQYQWPNGFQGASANSYGVKASERLYGMEYTPAPTQAITTSVLTSATSDFAEGVADLTDNISTVTPNTARWVIKLAAGALANGQYQVQTRIGSDLTTGPTSATQNQWSNLSNTYIWVGTNVPSTEKYQFMGDPLYEPYADAKQKNRYNWSFIDISTNTNSVVGSTVPWAGYYETAETGANNGLNGGWNGTTIYDVPRFYQMYRDGLLNARGLWTTMTGWSFYYSAIGGDMGDDGTMGYCTSYSAGPPSSCGGQLGIPIDAHPWGGTGTAYVNEIVGGPPWNDAGSYTYAYARLISASTGYWAANPWQGELYPDDYFANNWVPNGNLPTCTTCFFRAPYTNTFGAGANTWTYSFKPEKRVAEAGAPTFFNSYPLAGTNANWFEHLGSGANSNQGDSSLITSTGTTIASVFNYALLPNLFAARPFQVNNNGTTNPDMTTTWTNPYYVAQETQASIMATSYQDTQAGDSAWTSAGLMKVQTSTGAFYAAVNGVGSQASFGSNDVAQLGLASMLYGFMEAGSPSNALAPIHQVPLVSITTPTVTQQFPNPTANVTIGWVANWVRWNGLSYNSGYPNGYTDPAVNLFYNVKYSPDGGTTWKNVSDNTPATFGVFDSGHVMTTPTVWNVGGFATGNYLILVECFRQGYPLHYTYQEMSVYLQP